MRRVLVALVAVFSVGTNLVCAQTPSDSRLKRIVDTKSIKIAYRSDATPFSFRNDQKNPDGYTIDLCKLIVSSMEKQLGVQGLKIDWVPVTTQTRFEAVANNQADMECGSSTITLGRMRQVDFSNIIFVETTGVVVNASAGINTASDLKAKKVAVVSGTTNEQTLVNLRTQGKLDVIIVPVKDREEGIAQLEGGKVDAYASDKLLLVGAKFEGGTALKLLPDDLSIEPYGIALPHGDWALRLAVNTGLAQIYGSGLIIEIFKKWFDQIGLRPGLLIGAAYQFGALSD